jgi:hypothetical protein
MIMEAAPVDDTGYQVVAQEHTRKRCDILLMRPNGTLVEPPLMFCDTYKARHYVTTYARYAQRYLAGQPLTFIFARLKEALDKEVASG